MKLEKIIKPKYPQPHNVIICGLNVAYAEHLRLKIHGKLKYIAKYQKSKYSRRMK